MRSTNRRFPVYSWRVVFSCFFPRLVSPATAHFLSAKKAEFSPLCVVPPRFPHFIIQSGARSETKSKSSRIKDRARVLPFDFPAVAQNRNRPANNSKRATIVRVNVYEAAGAVHLMS